MSTPAACQPFTWRLKIRAANAGAASQRKQRLPGQLGWGERAGRCVLQRLHLRLVEDWRPPPPKALEEDSLEGVSLAA